MRFYWPRARLSILAAGLCTIAAILIFLCLYSCSSPSMRHIYFLKMSSGPIDIYFGWRYHCVVESDQTNCFFDNVIEYPLDTVSANLFNATYPQMFANQVTMDAGTQPLFNPTPLHNPQIVASAILCLMCSLGSALVVILRATTRKVTDKAYGRGFLALLGATFSMILLTLVAMLYENGEQILNLEFPNIHAETGNGKSLVGISFGLLFGASGILLRRCLDDDDTGYNELS